MTALDRFERLSTGMYVKISQPVVLGGSPDKFAALIRQDIARWGQIVRDSGAKVE